MMPVSKNSLVSLKELQAIGSLFSIAMNSLIITFMSFRNSSSALLMFLTAEIGNLITQYTDVGCVLLQLMQYMQSTAKATSVRLSVAVRLLSALPPMPATGHWKGLFTFHSFPVLSSSSAVFCLWAVKELNLFTSSLHRRACKVRVPHNTIWVEHIASLPPPWRSNSCLQENNWSQTETRSKNRPWFYLQHNTGTVARGECFCFIKRFRSFVTPEPGWASSAWNPWPRHSLRTVHRINRV